MSYWLEERRRDDERHSERNRKAADYDRVAAELTRLRLTGAERDVLRRILRTIRESEAYGRGDVTDAAVIDGLLERTK